MSNKLSSSGLRKPGNSKKRALRTDNFLESFRDIGGQASNTLKKDIFEGIPSDIMRQIFGGAERPSVKASGNINPGESLDIQLLLEEEREENKILKGKLAHEKRLREEESVIISQKGQELRVELHALTQEVVQLSKSTEGLARETQIAAMQAPVSPGIYHVVFFEKIREFIRSFRKSIESASVWMQAANQRASKKKTFWGQVGKSGAKRLLSQEDYMQRSAG
ncbi:MAG: hypothetical protein A2694_01440 [Candidatus Blackburnbacteria bacterium RIFCSPHIGHO2_01_FULL_40_17]|uniref:DUF5660 domain-containing protein n=2 Tax=Patescibacteria group TaxID=1783273 RepID=A0A0G1A5V4_9BACT|nr:MAG: hypothetical protein UV20_C0012G0003 [Candidatus Magasanikbacteria bacterium GW2011_GWA2_42_32]OGY07054.1 MAG: hypothetical protein A2694_01440 [Candidatus Blackburnbacteria bacterium RIFCSPHIGHO2_01_FULL_40_17]OGY13482.1 MAG: hypothetical protein A3A77_00120 [Candidatus Blackburnbacteria bacterium RIFCSPLOWO2_01_FULL_40_20]OGY14986.1 MAG: hypothetical protein A3I52_01305 [Candidatus Blackburnbacteria bacterium RIFCSPLOWO2_02_FULL_40_10]HBL52419.1 hypothetical protein [Candidatus Blackb